MKWKKLGLIFAPDKNYNWMVTHASLPIASRLAGDLFRIYFSSRDTSNKSYIGFIDVDLNNPLEVRNISETPVLVPGERGLFDDSGISLACIIDVDGKKFLYYIGWNLCATVPWRNSIGLAVRSDPSPQFEKYGSAPVMDRNNVDPLSLSYPYVIGEHLKFKMWYGSNISWTEDKRTLTHVIKYAESEDGIHWHRDGVVCIDFKPPDEYAISRPSVIKDGDLYRMWYSYRGTAYRIGYAESPDGIRWTRKDDEVGIDVSPSGWDSEMIEYPFVFDHGGKRYMLYNGNGYGRTGFGIAVLKP